MPTVSVVIPTRDRIDLLRRTLRSLAAADEVERLEVLVIDDGSDPPIESALGSEVDGLRFRVHRQEGAGLNAGRNTGIAETSGEVVAFLDDDVRVAPEWPRGVISAFEEGTSIAVAAGRTLPDADRPLPEWIQAQKLQYISILDLGDEAGPLPPHTGPVGANLAIARAWIERVGGFRAGLDRIGRSLISGGDTDLVRRIEAAGGEVVYWPAATVHHFVPAERLTRSWFRRRAEAQGMSDVRARYTDHVGPRELGYEAVRPLRAGGIAIKRLARRKSLVDAELWLWSSRGRWRELRRIRRELRGP